MRVTHRHRETRKSKVLNIPSYHIVYPPIDGEKAMAALTKATDSFLGMLERYVAKEEAKELGFGGEA